MLRNQDENAVSVVERFIERAMLGVSLLMQVRQEIRSFALLNNEERVPCRLRHV